MSYRKERVGFRFLNLTKAEADELSAYIPNPKIRPQYQKPDKYVVSLLWMNPEDDYSWIETLIRKYGLSEEKYGFFVSLVTESDSEIVAVPKFARALFRRIGGELYFSFTFVGEDKDPDDEHDAECGVAGKSQVK